MTTQAQVKSKPRILCFHGAGSSGAIFRAQGRKIFRALQPEFRFVFLNAPFPSVAGPGMRPTYEGSGPFFRWNCDDSATANFDITDEEVQQERAQTLQYLSDQLCVDDGAPFVGIMAFSQGARVATGLLCHLEKLKRKGSSDMPDIKFAVINSGTYPPLLLDSDADVLNNSVEERLLSDGGGRSEGKRLLLPSIHLQGSQDPWRPESERLLEDFFTKEQATVIEFTGGHQVPVSDNDTAKIVEAIRRLAESLK